MSAFEAAPEIDQEDNQSNPALSADYHYGRVFKSIAKYQYIDNTSAVDRYNYDRSIMKQV
jgi:hypothetical protein